MIAWLQPFVGFRDGILLICIPVRGSNGRNFIYTDLNFVIAVGIPDLFCIKFSCFENTVDLCF